MISLNQRLFIILARPEKPENIGLAARAMKNTGFENLVITGLERFDRKSYVTAVHAEKILDGAVFFPTLDEATADKNVVLASTSKKRKNFPLLSLDEASSKIFEFPQDTRIGLLFGNEITGLTSEELARANFHFTIPQVGDQPSYNLGAAVLLTLFSLFTLMPEKAVKRSEKPLPREEQVICIRTILEKLENKNFIHPGNKQHMTERIFDLFGRLAISEKDRKLLLAIFDKGPSDL